MFEFNFIRILAGLTAALPLALAAQQPAAAASPGIEPQQVRVHILSKYRPREISVEINGEALQVGANSRLPLYLRSTDGRGFRVTIHGQDVSRNYHGHLQVRAGPGTLILINEVPLLSYVASATIGEVGWVEPEAMKAQAVLIATNALRRGRQAMRDGESHSDISDLAYHQVYPGHNRYVDRFLAMLREMPHLPLLQQPAGIRDENSLPHSELVDAVFHAECGRKVFSAKEIWGSEHAALQARRFDGEFSPGAAWRKPIDKSAIDAIFAVESGRYRKLKLDGRLLVQVNDHLFGIDDFRLMINRRLGWNTIESNDFEIELVMDQLVFTGYGRGHGVGLCQVQSNQLARSGWRYREILAYFYPDAALL